MNATDTVSLAQVQYCTLLPLAMYSCPGRLCFHLVPCISVHVQVWYVAGESRMQLVNQSFIMNEMPSF